MHANKQHCILWCRMWLSGMGQYCQGSSQGEAAIVKVRVCLLMPMPMPMHPCTLIKQTSNICMPHRISTKYVFKFITDIHARYALKVWAQYLCDTQAASLLVLEAALSLIVVPNICTVCLMLWHSCHLSAHSRESYGDVLKLGVSG